MVKWKERVLFNKKVCTVRTLMKAYQVKIVIKNSKPPIWRRLIIPAGITFSRLSRILDKAMGWSDSTGFEFEFYHTKVRIVEDLEAALAEGKVFEYYEASEAYIEEFLDNSEWFTYTCDREKLWSHRVDIEQVLDDYSYDYPTVLKYKGECPENAENPFYDFEMEAVNEEMQQEYSYIQACLKTCGMLHGITPMDIVLKMVNKHPGLDMTMEELDAYIKAIPTEFCEYIVKNGKLYHETLFPNDGGLLKSQENKSFYVPAYQEICEYGYSGANLKQDEMVSFMSHLEKELGADKEKVKHVSKIIQNRICNGCNYEEIIAILDEYGLMVSEEQELERLMDRVFELWHNTRMLMNRGYTPKETSALAKKGATVSYKKENPEYVKIYPNDPCPCGSGKKYKKCCGKAK